MCGTEKIGDTETSRTRESLLKGIEKDFIPLLREYGISN